MLIYGFSFEINVLDPLWNHRNISAGLTSWADAGRLFTRPQADGFYRPLSFLSLWVDYRIFGEHLWGYHAQNLILHMLNAALIFALALAMTFSHMAARWAAWLWSAAAVNFEAVMWPAARFDLLATCFILIALVSFVHYANSSSRLAGCACAVAYGLALLNKETAYAFPVVAGALVATGGYWGFPKSRMRALVPIAVAIVAITTTMLAVRIAVFGNLGGYPPAVLHSTHFALQWRTFWSLINRVMLIPLLGVNTTAPLLGLAFVAIGLFAAFLVAAILVRPQVSTRLRLILAVALIAALPVANIVGWVGPSMQHSRYLYFPPLFLFLAVAAAFAEARWGRAALALLLLANCAGALNNLWVYREVHARARSLATSIGHDMQQEHTATVEFVGVPSEPQGVFYFYSELTDRLRRSSGAQIIDEISTASPKPSNRLIYVWDAAHGTLRGPQK